jgi:phosphoribosylglycinamide formyltransferase-1
MVMLQILNDWLNNFRQDRIMGMRCAVFASGGGSNFQALIDKKEEGVLDVEFVLLIGNNSNAAAFDRAKKHGVASMHIAPAHFTSDELYTQKLLSLMEENKVELIILAGYMKKLPEELIARYKNRIINIHPGLLPAFGGQGMYGSRVHQAVIDHGAKVTGVTVHFVDEEYDKGPIIAQACVNVDDSDDAHTLGEKVLKVEHATYWRAVKAIAENRLTIQGRRVFGNV